MKLDINRLFPVSDNHREPVLLAITSPRTGERTLLGVENLLGSIAVPEPFSLEIAGGSDGVALLARCMDGEVVRSQLMAHYPQAGIQQVPLEDDPLRTGQDEHAWEIVLQSSGPEYVPLRVFRDDDLLDAGSDPLIAILGAISDLNQGERVIARLLLRSLGPDWSQPHQVRAHRRPATEPRETPHSYQTRPLQTDGIAMAVLGAGVLGAAKSYLWVQDGEFWKAGLLGAGAASGLIAAAWTWHRWRRKRSRIFDPLLIREKVSRIAFDAELRIVAIVPKSSRTQRAIEVLNSAAGAYRHYDNPAGARFIVGKVKPAVQGKELMRPSSGGLFRSRSVLGVREAAALWHPPGARDETPLVERSGARILLPQTRGVRSGAHVGFTVTGTPKEIHFPEELMKRHHFYVARTRMGKSTLMQHLVVHQMQEIANGSRDAIVVLDPHADLVGALLQHVPASISDRVRLIDLADDSMVPGINLLDTRMFADRDRTADSVVRIARGLWEQWGPRMQSILEQTVKTIHEVNEGLPSNEQLTILDGLRLLTDEELLGGAKMRVNDPYLLDWWARDFAGWHRQYRAEALAPVQTRLSYYASSKKARAVLGQSESTIDVRNTILDGGILLVSTAQGSIGRDVSALVGASLLNLVDAVIREQGSLPPEQRRSVLVVVDEMQTMPGVDYESMLSELGKFGASFVLATQSLAKLDDLSPTMRDTLLANVGCLAVFQVSGADARHLVWELGRERISEEDVTSLPVHHCYVRATTSRERLPVFSMVVRRPESGDSLLADSIRKESAGYSTIAGTVPAGSAGVERLVKEHRNRLKNDGRRAQVSGGNGGTPSEGTSSSSGRSLGHAKRKKQRSKRNQQSPTVERATVEPEAGSETL